MQSLMSVKEQDMSWGGLLGNESESVGRGLTAKDLVLLRIWVQTLQGLPHSPLAEENMAGPGESSSKHIARSLSCEIDGRPDPSLCLPEVRNVRDICTCRAFRCGNVGCPIQSCSLIHCISKLVRSGKKPKASEAGSVRVCACLCEVVVDVWCVQSG